jgi:hypothetical protein
MRWNPGNGAAVQPGMLRRVLALTVLMASLAACGGASLPTTSQGPGQTTTSTGSIGATRPPADQAVIDTALADLSERLGVPDDQIEVQSFTHVTWSDGSLGCSKPGQVYTQALVEGSRIILAVGGDTYDYHAGSDGQPFLCEKPTLSSGPGLTVPTPTDR